MIAVREFRYWDHQARKSVVVPEGAEIQETALKENKVDIDKLVRTKYTGQESLTVVPVKRGRGRPRKTA